MRPVLLIDFGSTYTKATAVDLDQEVILGTSPAFTTSDSDIGEGLTHALDRLCEKTGVLDYTARLACSSAAGGLRMMVSGLVPQLTAQAAKLAALGAGAKICRVFSHGLSRRDLEEIQADPPDIFLLTGGTDGGNRECIIGNAEKLATLTVRFPIILAGNRNAVDDCEDFLSEFPVTLCPNVMPHFGELDIEPVQREIRKLFLSRIVSARGLSKTQELLSGILMPTPSAILSAMVLLAGGTDREPGLGDLMAIDVGGATTDVYSIGWGEPDDINIILKGFEEPYAKRTVEGDIGVRYSAQGIVNETGLSQIACQAEVTEDQVQALLLELTCDKSLVARKCGDAIGRLDDALAAGAVDIATRRHAGTLSEVYTVTGVVPVQTGKNLRRIRRIILTGGPLIHADDPLAIARRALFSDSCPMSLRPLHAEILMDSQYILSAMGVLAEREPDVALRIMKKELVRLGECRATDGDRRVAGPNIK